ncbi:MAG: hypothetical protein LWY06_04360 [Firmicutes bacterium]|nr:hypothetical protein [Bacillota bacterium]
MFFKRVTALPNECLIIACKGKMQNLGNGASAVLMPGSSYAFVPVNARETEFSMTQQSSDGISMRFKGILIYRVSDPLAAAKLFNFSDPQGIERISQAVNHLCLGELRHIVSNMTMDRCITERKTTLTDGVREAIKPVIEGNGIAGHRNEYGWGIVLDVVQIAQVFLADDAVSRQIQAEAKDHYRKIEELSNIKTQQDVDFVRMKSEQEKAEKAYEIEKQDFERNKQTQALRAAFEQEKILSNTAIKMMESEKRMEVARLEAEKKKELEIIEAEKKIELEMMERKMQLDIEKMEMETNIESDRIALEKRLENEMFELEKNLEIARKELELKEMRSKITSIETKDLIEREQALAAIRKEILPIEILPEVSKSLSGMFANSSLSFYGADNTISGSVGGLLDVITGKFREAYKPNYQ